MSKKPDPRFQNYFEVKNNNKVIGFRLQNDSHIYKFDEFGGWHDKQGRYFNEFGIEESEQPKTIKFQQKKLNKQVNFKQYLTYKWQKSQSLQRIQVINDLLQIIDNYDSKDKISIKTTCIPQLNDQDIQKQIFRRFKIKVQSQWGKITTSKNQSYQIVKLQGTKIKNSIIYFDISLKNATCVTTKQPDYYVLMLLQKQGLKKGRHFGNIESLNKNKTTLEVNNDVLEKVKKIIEIEN